MNTENVPGGAKTPRITEYLDQQAHAAVAQASSSLSLITGLLAFLVALQVLPLHFPVHPHQVVGLRDPPVPIPVGGRREHMPADGAAFRFSSASQPCTPRVFEIDFSHYV